MGNCLMNTFCCEHNCIIFPAPNAQHDWNFQSETIQTKNKQNSQINLQLNSFENEAKQRVPYMQLSSLTSRKKNEIIIYFHGNAEDIFHSIDFVLPIFKATEITILCLQYPTYSCYQTDKTYYISDRIKENSVQFHKHIQKTYSKRPENIYIIGRSIGTGPAAYLASKVKCEKLVLISPFDTIRKVSRGLVGCIGFMIKNHFSNEESILDHHGSLLVIHGKIDEVINFKHGKTLVEAYESGITKKKCTFIQPSRMSHNNFDMINDIVKPIQQFLTTHPQNLNWSNNY